VAAHPVVDQAIARPAVECQSRRPIADQRDIGNTANVHHPKYNFNDEAIPAGCSWWAEIVERRLPAA
jgi:metal-dependent amidase/aminoacylase/carboxypeptidase family protein